MRKNAKMEKAAKSISDISFEVDRLAGQVSAIESVISKGGKVAEKTLLNVIELLMNQLLKLDGITVDDDVKLQRKLQDYVETLDALKLKNSTQSSNGSRNHDQEQRVSDGNGGAPHQSRWIIGKSSGPPAVEKHQPPSSESTTVTTEWEIFDSLATSTPTIGTSIYGALTSAIDKLLCFQLGLQSVVFSENKLSRSIHGALTSAIDNQLNEAFLLKLEEQYLSRI
ncbi:hypothetical protein L2E82_29800 [Cichorium intybus]|uniref:Uncharacterized protein n=1 Tax=Cichorium intybus TaxID=13427 RepID=A0ACB9CYR9_CICIN|nr:hypothetical protein L2E82_29800 [Cichorium intybus]